jgi:protein-tyrosine phosphatase
MSDATRVLFVCLGNICRSPLAEVVVRDRALARGLAGQFRFASAGTGDWHIGKGADPRSAETAHRYGHDLSGHRARQITAAGIGDWQWFVAMDADNHADLLAMGAPDACVLMMRRFEAGDSAIRDVPDPYYGGPQGFDRVHAMLSANADPLLDFLLAQAIRAP